MKLSMKVLALAALLVGGAGAARAQSATAVAEGTTNSYIVPLQYASASYAQWSQSIYTAADLTALSGRQLTAFTYRLNQAGTAPDPGVYTVSLAITTNADLTGGRDNTPTTQVFSGTPTVSGNELTFTFDTPFAYNGGNLLVHFDRQAGTTTTAEALPFCSVSRHRGSWSGRDNAVMSDYNGTGTYFDYLPSVWVTATDAEPDTCQRALPYEEDFSVEGLDASMRCLYAAAPQPQCWTVLGNGRFTAGFDTTATASTYFSGIGTMTNTNSYGCVTANDPYFGFIAYGPYDGTLPGPYANMANYGTRKYAVLPPFDHPIGEVRLSFDRRFTNKEGAELRLGYIVADTSDFVTLKTIPTSTAAWRVTHRDTLNYASYAATIPAGARIAMMWQATEMTHTGDVPANYFCGIDNLRVETADPDPLPDPTLFDSIVYWVGTGSAEALLVMDFDSTARAWGYRFSPSATPTVADMIAAIDEADPRLAYTISWDTYEQAFFYYEHPLHGVLTEYAFTVDGEAADADEDFEDYDLADGMVVRVGATGCAWTATVVPASVKQVPADATIAAEAIGYWVGEGANEAVLVVNWGVPDTALAWGLRFDGALTVAQAVSYVASFDERLSCDNVPTFIDYNDGSVSLHSPQAAGPSGGFNTHQFVVDGNPNAGWGTALADGSMVKIGESAYAIGIDSTHSAFGDYPTRVVWTTPIVPVSNPADTSDTPVDPVVVPESDSAFAADDVLFWVGEGDNRVVMAINWADTALAWGYRFGTDSVLVADVVAAVVVADPRLSIEGSSSFISDFLYADQTTADTLRLSVDPDYAGYIYFNMTVNHISSMLGAGLHKVADGDFIKFGDTYVAQVVDSSWVSDWGGYWDYVLAWPYAIHPASVPDSNGTPQDTTIVEPEHGPFCGPVGTDGCNAIKADSTAIVGWATGIELARGPQNISVEGSPLASYGSAEDAIGQASDNNMRAVSLGDGGSVLVTFARPIRNGEGPDFAVFENGFANLVVGNYSLELAFVEVSTDGERFVRFPATSLTQSEVQIANAGSIDPTMINNLAGKFEVGYGTPFDLEELRDSAGINIDSIVYVRIVDVVGSIDPQYATRDAEGRIINDPWPTPFASSGFDLTGVAVLHQLEADTTTAVAVADEAVQFVAWPNPATTVLNVRVAEGGAEAVLLDMTGRAVLAATLQQGDNGIGLAQLAPGVYMLRVGEQVQKIVKR